MQKNATVVRSQCQPQNARTIHPSFKRRYAEICHHYEKPSKLLRARARTRANPSKRSRDIADVFHPSLEHSRKHSRLKRGLRIGAASTPRLHSVCLSRGYSSASGCAEREHLIQSRRNGERKLATLFPFHSAKARHHKTWSILGVSIHQ